MKAQILTDKTWYGTQYTLPDIFIPVRKVKPDYDMLCVMNRNKDNFYTLPISIVTAAQQVDTGREIVYALSANVLRQVYLFKD